MFHSWQSSNSVKQLRWIQLTCTCIFSNERQTKTKDRRRSSAYLHFLEALPSWSPSERQIMDAARTNHIIRFGPLTFRPVKGKLKKKQQMNSNYRCNGTFVSHSKWKQVTWLLTWSFTQSQLTKMLASEYCTAGTTAGQRENLAVLRQTLRPPKRSKRIATLDITCSSQSRIFNGTASVYFICFNSILLLTILVI